MLCQNCLFPYNCLRLLLPRTNKILCYCTYFNQIHSKEKKNIMNFVTMLKPSLYDLYKISKLKIVENYPRQHCIDVGNFWVEQLQLIWRIYSKLEHKGHFIAKTFLLMTNCYSYRTRSSSLLSSKLRVYNIPLKKFSSISLALIEQK